jgi:hygromycin-B 7''-O-kinase
VKLPRHLTYTQFKDLFLGDSTASMDLAKELCRRHHIAFTGYERFGDCANLVVAVNPTTILKVFPPMLAHQAESDRRVIPLLTGKLEVPTPELFEAGSLDEGWTYIFMSRLYGLSMQQTWPQMNLVTKTRHLMTIGRIMRQVHSLEVADLDTLEPLWERFLPDQARKASDRHQRLKMPAWFIEQVAPYCELGLSKIPQRSSLCLLTGEYTPFNLLTDESGQVLTAMIDFGDSMIGWFAYDFLGPSLFLGEGNPQLIAALFEGYGQRWPDPDLRRDMMVLQILHRYSDFDAQLRIQDWKNHVSSIKDLEKLIWPFP